MYFIDKEMITNFKKQLKWCDENILIIRNNGSANLINFNQRVWRLQD
jgi:hypothetical protein